MPAAAQGRAERPRGLYLVTPDEPDTADALRDRGLGYAKLGYQRGARADLARYLHLYPRAADSGSLRERLVDLGVAAAMPH